MQDRDGAVATRRSRADLDARLRKAVAMHAARQGMLPDQVVDAVERFLDLKPRSPEVPLEELRHRMKNEMQLLSSAMRQRRGMADADHRDGCDACIGQVAALAQLNATVDDASGAPEIDLARQALEFASALRRACDLDTGERWLEIRTEQVFVPRKVARNVLLIMNEAVTNAAKHGVGAVGGAISIALASVPGDGAALTVENETSEACSRRDGGNGQSLIDALAADIGGHVAREAGERSFRLTCRFPVPQPRFRGIAR